MRTGCSGLAEPVITSPTNRRLKLVRRLESRRQRERLGLFVCEGEDLVSTGLDAGLEPVEALVDAERPALAERLPRAELVAPHLMAELSTLPHPARVIAVFRRADLPPGPGGAAGLALWQVHDPGNVGTLIRTVDALGPGFVALSPGCADPAAPKALRASMGSLFRVPLTRFHEAPGPRVALVPRADRALSDLDLCGRATFVLGAEREGLPAEVLARCDQVASIPLSAGAESLNVAAAGAIALYELRRREPPESPGRSPARATQTVSSPPLYGRPSNQP
jgi:RNA methyltransferase, TrmH family